MTRRVALYILAVVCLAAAVSVATFLIAPDVHGAPVRILVALALLGVVAEVVRLLLPSSASISMAAIPFLAAALISPTWLTIAVLTIAVGLSQVVHRRQLSKSIFNIAQSALSISVAVLTYRVLGGHPLLAFNESSLLDVTMANGLPVLALILTSMLVNTASVSGVVALSQQKNFVEIWRKNHLSTLGYDILAIPFICLFAWATVKLGPLGAALLGVPAIGFHQLYKTKLDLERAHQDLLQLMVKAIEARDPYTSGHSRRVQRYSMIIARAVGLKDREVERIGFAALLHDVGKIHDIYAPILRKPDKLTPEERAVMQTHSLRSAELVATVSSLRDLVGPVRHHHENWDGSGYPDGLAGETIPLASRIIMFADTIDAMTSDRPYRKALSEAQVRAELMKFRGKQFDPNICDRLLESPLFAKLFTPISESTTPAANRAVSPSRQVRAVVGR